MSGTKNEASLRAFLDKEDPSLLGKAPLEFDQAPNFKDYLCCQAAALMAIPSMWFLACCKPVAFLAPRMMVQHATLQLSKDALHVTMPNNDCCCHVDVLKKSIPLDKIQEVQLSQGCCESCFGLHSVMVQTSAGGASNRPEVMANWLQHPAEAQKAIQLAAKLHREAALVAPAQARGMQRKGGDAGGLAERLEKLGELVKEGVLSGEEAARLRPKLLAAQEDPTARLREAATLWKAGTISRQELEAVKAQCLG